MAKWGSVDLSQLKTLQTKFEELEKVDVDKFYEAAIKDIAQRLLARVKQKTPVGVYEESGKNGGTLRRNWTISKNVTKQGTTYSIEIINPIEYASYVEYGHRQEVGRYVPAIGKKLVKPWVEGKFMLTISEVEVEALTPKLLQARLNKMLKGKMNA